MPSASKIPEPPPVIDTELSKFLPAAQDYQDTWMDHRDDSDTDDPYTYSDDSASLSDAYFFPQEEESASTPVQNYGTIIGTISEEAALTTTQVPTPNTQVRRSSSSSKQQHHHHHHHHRTTSRAWHRERAVVSIRGKRQRVHYRDVWCAVVFLFQLLFVTGIATKYGIVLFQGTSAVVPTMNATSVPKASLSNTTLFFMTQEPLDDDDDTRRQRRRYLRLNVTTMQADDTNAKKIETLEETTTVSAQSVFNIDFKNILALVLVSGVYASLLTYLSFGFLLILSRAIIPILLVVSVLLAAAWGMIGLTVDPYGVVAFLGFFTLVLTLGYALAAWSHVAFSGTNLHVALVAIRCTADITILGLTSLLVAVVWSLIWTMAFVGVVDSWGTEERHWIWYGLLLLSFHWTNTVIKNVVRTVVASAIGTWWFHPDAIQPFCTRAVTRPLMRALSTQLGSICLGSLVVRQSPSLLCRLLDSPTPRRRSSRRNRILRRPQDVALMRRVVLYLQKFFRVCNRWSFTYIGMCKCCAPWKYRHLTQC